MTNTMTSRRRLALLFQGSQRLTAFDIVGACLRPLNLSFLSCEKLRNNEGNTTNTIRIEGEKMRLHPYIRLQCRKCISYRPERMNIMNRPHSRCPRAQRPEPQIQGPPTTRGVHQVSLQFHKLQAIVVMDQLSLSNRPWKLMKVPKHQSIKGRFICIE